MIWININCNLLSKRNQTQKAAYCMIPFKWHLEKHNTRDGEKICILWLGGLTMNRATEAPSSES